MSTQYYTLKYPINYLKVVGTEVEGVVRLILATDRTVLGALEMYETNLPEFLRLFADTDNPVLRAYWGGEGKGMVVIELKYLPSHTQVISDAGFLTTAGGVKNRR